MVNGKVPDVPLRHQPGVMLGTAVAGLIVSTLFCATVYAGPAGPSTADGKAIRFDFLEPGFSVRELPVHLKNINNVEYAADGRLFAVGYDGRVFLLRDTDGDGLEDSATLFYQGKGDYETPLGVVVRDDSVYVALRGRIERLRDTHGTGTADKMEVVAGGWHDAVTDTDKTFLHRRVDDAVGLAMDAQGNFYTSLGTPNYQNLDQLDADGKSHYRTDRFRGSVLRVAPGGKPQIVATGVRFAISMQFNRHGDLFATDQEGATWGPGNPLDKLIQIVPGRHYGFPPRDPRYLPDVVDEPSVVDFGPQHQSSCGFRFDETRPGSLLFGPADWEDNAIVTGESRGKLWRVPLIKTRAGYVGKPVLIGSLNMLAVDVAISPAGDLVVSCHGGKPDWGSGPGGEGRLFKVRYTAPHEPRLAVAWPAGITEVRAAFTEALPADAAIEAEITAGRYVRAGDDLESFRPGYKAIEEEQAPAPRHAMTVLASHLSDDGRTVTLTTSPHPWLGNYAIALHWKSQGSQRGGSVRGDYDFDGVYATWTPSGKEQPAWSGWLPHPNLDVARGLTLGSAEHDALFEKLKLPGTLRISGTLMPPADPAILEAIAGAKGTLKLNTTELPLAPGEPQHCPLPAKPQPFTVTLETGGDRMLSLTFTTRTVAVGPEHPSARQAVVTPDAPTLAAPGAPAKRKTRPAFVRGNADRGRTVFEANCVACHTFRGNGGKVGPDLSNSPERDAAALHEDIVDPNAAINPDYIGYQLRLDSDDILAGTVTTAGPGVYRVQQASGVPIEVKQSDIKSMRQLSTSLMPVGFAALGAEPLRDLITYLTTN
jgi:putative heme-binding domain-containing protein